MSPNSLVDHQMLVVCVQNAFEIKLGHLELLELSFGSVDPTFFNNHQVYVLVNPNVGLALVLLVHCYPFVFKQCWNYRASVWCIEVCVAPNVHCLTPLSFNRPQIVVLLKPNVGLTSW